MKKICFFSVLFAVITLTAYPQNSCNDFYVKASPDGNYLYFSSDRDGGNYELYRTDIDGHSNPVRLTNSPGNKMDLSISPDGSKIVYQQSMAGTQDEIFIMNSDGTGATQLTSNDVLDGYPDFSPDGNTIIFSAWDDTDYPEVFTMNPDGSNRTQLTNEPGAFHQVWGIFNPSGTKIYFLEAFNADNHIVMMDSDGTNWVDITPPNTFGQLESNVQFNEDGSKIIFFTTEWKGYNNGSDIVIADADGSNWNRITNANDGEWFYSPTFGKGNNKVYYTYFLTGEKFSIWSMDLDGSNKVRISDCGNVGVEEPSARPAGIIYPNPVSTRLHIDYPGSFSVEICSLPGVCLLRSNDLVMDISALSKGIYFVILRDKSGTIVMCEKLIRE